MLKHALTTLIASIIMVGSAVAGSVQAQAAVNVYTTPGRHVVNGREWRTTCSPYDANITRCRAEIMSAGRWVFNNLTYLTVDRKFWLDNPLARPGTFTSGGREWLTSCNDDWTGASACRTFIRSGGEWWFNNLVYFTPGTVDYPKFTFNQSAGRLTASPTPSTRYWTLSDVSLHSSATGAAVSGWLAKGEATIVTHRRVGERSEVINGGVFGWISTSALADSEVKPSAAPKPTAAVPPEPPVDPVVPPEPPVDPVSSAGSVPVGSADYPVPANAVFVTADGSRTGSGTSASPFGSLAYGIEKASAGSTIVMRGGTYHESTTVPFFKKLTIQSYPKEAVWLDGSSVVTGWQRAGSAWVVSGWNHIFDPRVSHTEGVDQSDFFLDPAFPMAGHPDQVWVSGAKLRQVASMGSVVPGTFFVDRPGRRLYIGTDPAGKRVEASTLQQGMVIHGTGTVVRGIGLRRYANTFWMGGAISTQVNDIVLENVVSTQNATQGIDGWGKKMRFNRITITESGALGLGLNTADDLVLSNSLIRKNNIESFEREPVSGGVKIARSRRVLISGNRFDQNTTTGLWFDVASFDVTVVGNTFSGNGASGLELEWSSRVVVANNYFIRNAQAGLFVVDANSISVWNNTFHDNKTYSIRIFQYAPRSSDPIFAKVRDVSVRNNILSYGPGSYQYITEDFERKETGQTMRVTSEGNAYHRASSTSPTNFAVWANGSRLSGYSNLTAFRAATGNDLRSTLNEGTSILTDRYQLTPAALGSTASVALPIPVTVASAIGVASNTRKLGAVSPIIE